MRQWCTPLPPPNGQYSKTLCFLKISWKKSRQHVFEKDSKLTQILIWRWEDPHEGTLKMCLDFLTEVIHGWGVIKAIEEDVNGVSLIKRGDRDVFVAPWSQTSDTTQRSISSDFIEPYFSYLEGRTNPSVAQKTQTFITMLANLNSLTFSGTTETKSFLEG